MSREADQAESKAGFLSEKEYKTIKADAEKLIKLLTSIIKTSKAKN
jgi:hypothetical protein